MQKLIISILCIFIITGSASAKGISKFKLGVQQYKSGNYIGCSETMKDVVNADPGNAVAHYYLAISYVQIGNKNEAIKEYNNVISLNPKSGLINYAKQGLNYLGAPAPATPEAKSQPQITNIPKETVDFMTDKVKDTMREKNLNKVINDANSNSGQVDSGTLKRLDNFSNKKSENKTPTKEQVAQAMQVLSEAGMSQSYNPEAMEMNMLMNSLGGQNTNGYGYGYNPMANMLPMMMMAQQGGNQKIDPQLMETMMTTMMMPGMMQMSGSNNDNY